MENSNIISEKLIAAKLPDICAPRRRLISNLNRSTDKRIVFISAPAGFGKTVSVLLWLDSSKRRNIWVGLDEYDNTPSIFYKLICHGFFSMQPDNEAMANILKSPSFSSSPVEHTISLIGEFEPENASYALVLDDMHLIVNEEILKSLPFVIKRLPLSFITFILTRGKVPESFEEYTENGRAVVINTDDLAFSQDEIQKYFASCGRSLTEEEAAAARAVTGGWAIGVNAIAKSGQLDFGQNGGQVLDRYIKKQIWDKWDEKLRDFMLKTCIVDEMTDELANWLTDKTDSKETLDRLCATNSFVSRLSENTYRYHHLFLDFLRGRLEESRLNCKSIYKKAAQYYMDKNDNLQALRFWFSGGDYKGINEYLYAFMFQTNNGHIAEYVDFLHSFFRKGLPEKAFSSFPALHVLGAWYYYLTGQTKEYEKQMDSIYRKLALIAVKSPTYIEFAVLAYHCDHRVDMATQMRNFHIFRKLIPKFNQKGTAKTIASYTQNMPYMHRSNRDYSNIAIDESLFEKLNATFAPLFADDWAQVEPGLRACFAYERNQLAKAYELILLTRKNQHEGVNMDGILAACVMMHSILLAMGKNNEAEESMAELERLVSSKGQFFKPNYLAYKTKCLLADGNRDAAFSWLDNYFVNETTHIEFYRLFQHFATARSYIVLGDTERAFKYLGMLRQFSEEVKRPLDMAEAITLQAATEWVLGKKKEAQTTLETALCLMQEYGFVRIFANEGAAVLPILRKILIKTEREGGALQQKYIHEITLAAYEQSKRHKGITAHLNPKPIKLSRQQSKILNLLANGNKYSEIAEITGLTIHTVKSHASAAYGKLDVNNSMDATLKARELGLIQ